MDILTLRDWYRTPTGHMARKYIAKAISGQWADISGKNILVVGYGAPYVKLWLKEAQVFCALPAKMGGIFWPNHAPNRAFLTWEHELPFADGTFDAILLMHSLEFTSDEDAFLWECNRVLKDDGNVLALVPNRVSAWSQREFSPLGMGRPFSYIQLRTAVQKASFMVKETDFALYTPPTDREWLHKYSNAFEKFGKRWFKPVGGVMLMNLRKDMHAGVVVRTETLPSKRFVFRPVSAYPVSSFRRFEK